jgi:hypothetical protein
VFFIILTFKILTEKPSNREILIKAANISGD